MPNYWESARTLVAECVESWLLDETLWFYEDEDLQDEGFELEPLQDAIRKVLDNL